MSLSFYAENYDLLGQWQLKLGERIVLGEREPRTCRFCGLSRPAVTFRLEAHAIPELLGNRSLFSLYECDDCNTFFGKGIENDLGNWSKPMRTLQRIRGKRGVPTLKGGKDNWRIEFDGDHEFRISHDRHDSVFHVDEQARRITFLLKRDPHVPMAVLKAFVKMGLSLMPEVELSNFSEAMRWIRNPQHRMEFELLAPIHRTFTPGPTPRDFISTAILRRSGDDKTLPYAFFILAAGNETFQVMLPAPLRDAGPGTPARSMPPFPSVRTSYGTAGHSSLNLSGCELVVNDSVSVDMSYEQGIPTKRDGEVGTSGPPTVSGMMGDAPSGHSD